MLIQAFRNILVVEKQTPYESYLQLKAQWKAPVRWGSNNEDLLSPLLAFTHSLIFALLQVALRWERLKNRIAVHQHSVETVTTKIIDSSL